MRRRNFLAAVAAFLGLAPRPGHSSVTKTLDTSDYSIYKRGLKTWYAVKGVIFADNREIPFVELFGFMDFDKNIDSPRVCLVYDFDRKQEVECLWADTKAGKYNELLMDNGAAYLENSQGVRVVPHTATYDKSGKLTCCADHDDVQIATRVRRGRIRVFADSGAASAMAVVPYLDLFAPKG